MPLGSDIKRLALSPTSLLTKLVGDIKEPTSLFKNTMGHRRFHLYSLAGWWGEIIYGWTAAAICAFTG